ncbi:ubiquinone biosynthesis accessory factor UbiJ [Thalassotalea sp. PLHSN55]|uniref:ubiquinone biosynthesis accessory factor UbiJ n=1 Tax=Thalassotalea sp. PLHSN55 TaxID=3435888 RepID=UPI003F876A3F
MYQQLLCAAIEKIIATALDLNQRGSEQLGALEQKTLALSLAELGFVLKFTVNNEHIMVTSVIDPISGELADCHISTSVKTVIELKKEQQLTELIKEDKLSLTGDIKIAQQFARIGETLNIDWRSELAKHIGDIPTYQLERFGQFVFNKLNFAVKQIQADASEYVVHEQRLVVTASQINHFNQQVTQVEHQTQQLATRLEQLMNNVNLPPQKAQCE